MKSPSKSHGKSSAKYWWMLAYFLLGGAIPLAVFLIEYLNVNLSNLTILERNEYHKFIENVIKVYSPLFIYAWVAGFFLPYYVIEAYSHFKHVIRNKKVIKTRRNVIIACISVATLVAFFDFLGGEPAIWEIKPPINISFVSYFNHADDSIPHSIKSKTEYKNSLNYMLLHGDTIGVKRDIVQVSKNSHLNTNWSITKYSYFFSLLIEAFFLNLFFYTCLFYYGFRHQLKKQNYAQFSKNVNGLIMASLLIFIWLLLRLMNSHEKNQLYPDHDLQIANIAVGILNIICLVFVLLSNMNDKEQKTAQLFINFISAIGISVTSVFAFKEPTLLLMFFGNKGSLASYVVFPIVFVLLYGAHYIINLGNDYKDEDENLELDV
ncbi:MAG: hypothetical protein P4L41_11790 [Flavipsychrobacter sp.]|nr:hypothetical protein [Flavipsychrobacter sp.]